MQENDRARNTIQSNEALLQKGIEAARIGDRERARRVLTQLVRRDPEHELAWLWLAAISARPRQARAYLRQVLRLNPRNRQAIRGLRAVEAQLDRAGRSLSRAASYPALAPAHVRLLRRWAGIWLLVAVLVIVLGGFVAQALARRNGLGWEESLSVLPTLAPSATPAPTPTPTQTVPQRVGELLPQLEAAWGARNWPLALKVLDQVARLDAAYPGLYNARCDTYFHWAGDRMAQGEVEEAYALYEHAFSVCQEPQFDQAKSLARRYLEGKLMHEYERWRKAAITLRQVYDANPEYVDTGQLLYTAYLGWARAALEAGKLEQARGAGAAAVALRQDEEALAVLHEAERRLAPTPTPRPVQPSRAVSGKRIEVNITQQRMYVWQGDTLLYQWVCSTGEPGRPTAPGHFSIQNKIPEAWASTWSLRMPYWLGIYYAGPLQNGIHALPILPSGQTLWAGYLGVPVSYGCVILSTENARTLYNWAEVGTPVWIHY